MLEASLIHAACLQWQVARTMLETQITHTVAPEHILAQWRITHTPHAQKTFWHLASFILLQFCCILDCLITLRFDSFDF